MNHTTRRRRLMMISSCLSPASLVFCHEATPPWVQNGNGESDPLRTACGPSDQPTRHSAVSALGWVSDSQTCRCRCSRRMTRENRERRIGG
uniref:Putative secreted protein n=1 Tax=Anopheles darlingi TaxID=43151 RepID=A0A2M4D4X3_ANODA